VIRAVHPSFLPPPGATEPLDPLLLAEIAAGLAFAVAQRHDDGSLTPNTEPVELLRPVPIELLRTERYVATLVDWPAGGTWDCASGHPAALHLVRGSLVETWTDLGSGDTSRVVGPGDTVSLWPALRRSLHNPNAEAARAVHVTSPRPPSALSPCHGEQLRLTG
jgi:hypothetical protein